MISPGCCNYDEPMENPSPPSVLGKRPRDDTSEQTPQESSKLFQCGDCRKSYSRVDHLARHVRLHTKVSLDSSPVLTLQRVLSPNFAVDADALSRRRSHIFVKHATRALLERKCLTTFMHAEVHHGYG